MTQFAQNIGLLGEALGIDLELVQLEKAVGAFSCDIQTRDTGRDRPVIIENQLEAKTIVISADCSRMRLGWTRPVIVWISPQVREEHREALD